MLRLTACCLFPPNYTPVQPALPLWRAVKHNLTMSLDAVICQALKDVSSLYFAQYCMIPILFDTTKYLPIPSPCSVDYVLFTLAFSRSCLKSDCWFALVSSINMLSCYWCLERWFVGAMEPYLAQTKGKVLLLKINWLCYILQSVSRIVWCVVDILLRRSVALFRESMSPDVRLLEYILLQSGSGDSVVTAVCRGRCWSSSAV